MNVIVDDIQAVVELMRTISGLETPYYLYGHQSEIALRLLQKDKSPSKKTQKYPLVALRLDTEEQFEDGMWKFNLNLAILDWTDKKYSAEQRYTNIFKPILYPLYEEFMIALRDSNLFTWEGDQRYPPHTKIDRPFWGTVVGENNERYIFNDPLDAIEILDLKISKTENCLL